MGPPRPGGLPRAFVVRPEGVAGRPRGVGTASGGARPSGRTCRARPGRGPTAPRLSRPGEGRGEGRGAGGSVGPLPEPRPPHPGRRSPARSAPVACAEKDGRSPSPLQGAQNGGRGGPGERAGESPTQRKRAFPSSAAASCDPTGYRAPSGHLASSCGLWSSAWLGWGRRFFRRWS